jgi:Tfp pilus assembly protein PilO
MKITALRHSSWIVTVPLTAAVLLYLMFLWLPANNELAAMRKNYAIMQEVVLDATNQETSMAATIRDYEKARAIASQWSQSSPGKRDILPLYERIGGLAKDAGLTLLQLDPEPMIAYENFRELPITVVSLGQYRQIHEFVRGIENLPAEIWIKSMNMEKTPSPGGQVRCRMDLAVFVKYP